MTYGNERAYLGVFWGECMDVYRWAALCTPHVHEVIP